MTTVLNTTALQKLELEDRDGFLKEFWPFLATVDLSTLISIDRLKYSTRGLVRYQLLTF